MNDMCDPQLCKKCAYSTPFAGYTACYYLGITSMRRPCAPGYGCTVYKPSKPVKPVSIKIVNEKRTCEQCKREYVGSRYMSYCPECAQERKKAQRLMYDRARAERSKNDEYAKIKICKACNAEYHNASTRSIYCDKCHALSKARRRIIRAENA